MNNTATFSQMHPVALRRTSRVIRDASNNDTASDLNANSQGLSSSCNSISLKTVHKTSESTSSDKNTDTDSKNNNLRLVISNSRESLEQFKDSTSDKSCLKNLASNMFVSQKRNKLPPITDGLLLTPAHKLSKKIKDGSLSSVKLCELYSERIKQVQPIINAMAQERFADALEEAKRIDELLSAFRSGKPESEFKPEELEMLRSPLLGVPVSVKESIGMKGMKNTCGLWNRRDVQATSDAVTVRNLRRFGMIPICTTNIPECTLFWADCQNKVYGRSLNPYDLARVTGASSGGEGALIASAGSVMGLGSDIAGSLRIPAHYCGINSHKPSPFLVSSEGNYPEVKANRLRLFTLGPMCRYATDLRPLFKCLLSDFDNSKQDTYYKFQPENIGQLRQQVLQKLDEPVDFSQIKLFYGNLNECEVKGKHPIGVEPEFMEAQQELVDHFKAKFNCQAEKINLDKFIRKALITWQCMIRGFAQPNVEPEDAIDELKDLFGINNMALEFLKMPLGLSNHTKESLLTVILGSAVPRDQQKAMPLCEKYEKFAGEIREELENMLGDSGLLIIPTLPTVAYKHNIALLKTPDVRFPAIFNATLMPVSHATMRLDKKHKLPFGFSIAAKGYNDNLTIAFAEEVEAAFGGWIEPTITSEVGKKTTTASNLATSSVGKVVEKKQMTPVNIGETANNKQVA